MDGSDKHIAFACLALISIGIAVMSIIVAETQGFWVAIGTLITYIVVFGICFLAGYLLGEDE